jgi:hypothetical protein
MTFLELLSEAVIVAACSAAAIGCFVLNRRVSRLASTERGIGKAVSEMSHSVSQFETLLVAAEESTREASTVLDEQLVQARKLVARLEMLSGAAPRTAAATLETSRKSPASADPLADVEPRGATMTAQTGQPAAGGPTSNGTAQNRLAELAQRRATITTAAADLGRRPRA